MKRILYLLLSLALLAGCSKDKGIEEPDEPDVPVAPEEVTLELSASDLVFESGGGKQEFTVSCNTAWTLSNESDWCMTDVTSGTGDKVVTVMVSASVETEDRNLHLSVSAGEKTSLLTVTEKHGDALVLAKDKFDLPTDGGDVSIEVKSDVEEVVIPAEYRSWISLAPETRASEIKCYVFIILETKGKDGRRGYIVFRSGERSDTVFIFQAPEERLILSEDTCHVSGKGGDLTVELKTNIAYDVTIPSSAASWVSRVTEHSFRSDRLKLHVEADSLADRNAEIVIRNRYGDESDTLYICQTSLQSPKEEVTAAFDPDFAGLLQRRGYIPDSTRILIGDVRDIDTLDVTGTYTNWYEGKGLTSLAGIEYFESLTTLYCYYNQLTSLDVSKNTALTYLRCGDNQLTSLDVSECTALKVLQCWNNQLTSLNVSKNTVLRTLMCQNNQFTSLDVSGCTALKGLQCQNNQLTSLDVSNNTALTFLDCYSNKLASLDISGCSELTYLDCSSNQLTVLDVSKNTALTKLRCHENQLVSLDVSQNTALPYLRCDANQLSSLDVSKNTVLADLDCSSNQLTSLDVNNNTVLLTLVCDSNQLSSLDVSKNTALTHLYCNDNPGDGKSVFPVTAWFNDNNIPTDLRLQRKSWTYGENTITLHFLSEEDAKDITADFDPAFAKVLQEKGYIPDATHITVADVRDIDTLRVVGTYADWKAGIGLTSLAGIEYFESLTYLNCFYNQLTSLDVSKNTALTYLNCEYNQLTSLDVSNNIALTNLRCMGNQLTSLDISKNTALKELWLQNNPLTSLDVSKNTALTELRCNNNQLTSLDVSNNIALTNLQCMGNQLTSLDVSQNTVLTLLAFSSNQVTSLDLSKNAKLATLYCNHNQLTSLDISKNMALTDLFCHSNQLTSLDIRNNTALTGVWCYENPGDGESLFPVTAWFDNSTIPGNIKLNVVYVSEPNNKSWTYDGKTITIDFRKAE